MSNWISATFQFPNAEQEVRLFCKNQWRTYQCIGFYVPEKMDEDKSDYCWDYEMIDYDEETDTNYVHPGWYERIYNWDYYGAIGINDEVLYWKPLDDGPNMEE